MQCDDRQQQALDPAEMLHALGRTLGLVPVTEQPMMRPWRRTPRYQLGPMRLIFTSWKPAFVNHCRATQ